MTLFLSKTNNYNQWFFHVFVVFMFILLSFFYPTKAWAISYNLANSSSYNIRFDGAVAGDQLGYYSLTTADIDNDGKQDIIVGTWNASNNTRAGSGSVYIIYNSLLSTFTSKNIDLATSSNWSIRIDGALASDNFGSWVSSGDINGDGKTDLVIGASEATRNGFSGSGAVYVFNNTLLSQYSGPGKTLDTLTATNYSLEIGGSAASTGLGFMEFSASDMDNDGKDDLILGEPAGMASMGDGFILTNSVIGDISVPSRTLNLSLATSYNVRIYNSNDDMFTYEGFRSADVDGDGKSDLLIGAANGGAGNVYFIKNSLLQSSLGSTGNDLDLFTSTNYNIRFNGIGGSKFGRGIAVGNFDGDSYPDLAVGSTNGTDSFKGAAYIILGKSFASLTGTGNVVSMSNPANYFLRFDGETGSQTTKSRVEVGDIDGDGRDDVLIPTMYTAHNGKVDSGSLYVEYSTLINSYSGTGNSVSLGSSSGYSVMYDGSTASGKVGYCSLTSADINNDGRMDIVVNEKGTNNNTRNVSGSLYIIYNFPHTLALNSLSPTTVNGNTIVPSGSVSVSSSSVTAISGVQYSIDSNSASGVWNGCSGTSSFFCTIDTRSFPDGIHTVFIRSYDVN
jgi:hypothetical protein